MSIETKKISELEQIAVLPEAANVLVEDSTGLKRFPANNLVSTGGGVSSWNDLTDKPFYGGEGTLQLQGDRVTDGTVLTTFENLPDKGKIHIDWDSDAYDFDFDYESSRYFGNESLSFWMAPDTGEPFYITVTKDNGQTILSFKVRDSEEHMISMGATGEVKTIDEKYIPDSIARKSDIPAGGGVASDVFCIMIYTTPSADGMSDEYHSNKTFAEVQAAREAGLAIIAVLRTGRTFSMFERIYDADERIILYKGGIQYWLTESGVSIPADGGQ